MPKTNKTKVSHLSTFLRQNDLTHFDENLYQFLENPLWLTWCNKIGLPYDQNKAALNRKLNQAIANILKYEGEKPNYHSVERHSSFYFDTFYLRTIHRPDTRPGVSNMENLMNPGEYFRVQGSSSIFINPIVQSKTLDDAVKFFETNIKNILLAIIPHNVDPDDRQRFFLGLDQDLKTRMERINRDNGLGVAAFDQQISETRINECIEKIRQINKFNFYPAAQIRRLNNNEIIINTNTKPNEICDLGHMRHINFTFYIEYDDMVGISYLQNVQNAIYPCKFVKTTIHFSIPQGTNSILSCIVGQHYPITGLEALNNMWELQPAFMPRVRILRDGLQLTCIYNIGRNCIRRVPDLLSI